MYFKLIVDVGAAQALTVAYLIPLFGILWGALLLDETIGWHTLAGCTAVLTGTALVVPVFPRRLLSPEVFPMTTYICKRLPGTTGSLPKRSSSSAALAGNSRASKRSLAVHLSPYHLQRLCSLRMGRHLAEAISPVLDQALRQGAPAASADALSVALDAGSEQAPAVCTT